MKKILILSLASLLITSCNQVADFNTYTSLTYDASIGLIKNLKFKNDVISFDKLDTADSYYFEFVNLSNEVLYKEFSYKHNKLDTSLLGLEGTMTFNVKGVKDNKFGPTSKLNLELLTLFDEVTFEAENYLYNFGTGKSGSNFRNNSEAHGGAYVGGIDDCGQGVYINYLCPFDGTYTLDAYYITKEPTALNGVWVNNEKQATFIFDKYSEWGGINNFDTNVASVEISLKKGWNTISIMKEGNESNNYGSYAELDYFVLHGNQKMYNRSVLEAEYGLKPEKLRLEAEMGSPRRKNEIGTFECKNPCIPNDMTFRYSNGYLMGALDNRYDGVEWQLYLEKETTYDLEIGFASGQEGAYATFFVTQEEIALAHGADFLDLEGLRIDLYYTGWNNVDHLDTNQTITLKEGKNFLYCIKMEPTPKKTEQNPKPENICIFQLDYIDLKEVK